MNPSQSQSSGYGMPTSGAQYGGSQQYGPPPNWNFASPSMGYTGSQQQTTLPDPFNPNGGGNNNYGTNPYGYGPPPNYGQQQPQGPYGGPSWGGVMTSTPFTPGWSGASGSSSGSGWGGYGGPMGGYPGMPPGNPAARGPAPWGGYGNQTNQSNPATRGAAPNGGYGQQDFGPMPPSATPGYGSGDNPAWQAFMGGAPGGSANPNAAQILDQRYAGWLSGTGGAPPMWTSGGG